MRFLRMVAPLLHMAWSRSALHGKGDMVTSLLHLRNRASSELYVAANDAWSSLGLNSALRPHSQSYVENGHVGVYTFRDAECAEPAVMSAIATNQCIVERGYAYIVRIESDSCAGGVVEYYFDRQCTKLAGTSILDNSIPAVCAKMRPGQFVNVVCTTAKQPLVFADSAVQMHFAERDCGSNVGYDARALNQCVLAPTRDDHDIAYEHDGENLVRVAYAGRSGCQGQALSRSPVPSTCQASDISLLRSPVDYTYTAQTVTPSASLSALLSAALPSALAAAATSQRNAPDALPEPDSSSQRRHTDDDVNYYARYDDDEPTYYIYDDYVYIYEHDEFDAGYQAGHDDGYTAPAVGDDDGAVGELGGFHPPPSVSATPFPTLHKELQDDGSSTLVYVAAPGRKDAVFRVQQTIAGVDLATYNAGLASVEQSLKQAVSVAVLGCTEDAVTDLVAAAVIDSAVAGSTLRDKVAHHYLRASSHASQSPLSAAVSLSYTVTVLGTVLSATGLAGQLQIAVSTGRFDRALQRFAGQNGATALIGVTTSSLTVSASSDSGDNSDPSLATGAIIAISIGGLMGLSILGCLLAGLNSCYMQHKYATVVPLSKAASVRTLSRSSSNASRRGL